MAQAAVEMNDPLVSELEAVLRGMVVQYEVLSSLSARRLDAMRHAKTRDLSAVIAEESQAIQRVAELEKRRLPVVAHLAVKLGAPAKGEVSVSWIAERLTGSAGERIAGLAARLRELMSGVVKQNETGRRTAETLASHMDGLLRQVAGLLNHARTYGPSGLVSAGARVVSAIDVRS